MATDTTTENKAETTESVAQPVETPKEAAPKKNNGQRITVSHNDTPRDVAKQQEALEMDTSSIVLGDNVRKELGNINELKSSIEATGIVQPLVATPLIDENGKTVAGKYMLVAGFRRYAAAKQLKLKTVPVRLVTGDQGRRLCMALAENSGRLDMNAMDKAEALRKLLELNENDQKKVASLVGISEGSVSQYKSLYDLPKHTQKLLRDGKLDLARARELHRLKGFDDAKVNDLADTAVNMSSGELKAKVEFLLQREKEKQEAAEQRQKEKAKTKKNGKSAASEEEFDHSDKEEETARQTFAEKRYGDVQLEPLKKSDLKDAIFFYANKYDRAESDTRKAEYKFILKGLEIAAGIVEVK